MDKDGNGSSAVPSAEELQKENRILKRKLTLAEQNLVRAQLLNEAKNRVEATISESIKKEQRFFQLVLENTTNIMLLLDFDGRFAYASKTYLDATDTKSFGFINSGFYKDILKMHVSDETMRKLSEGIDRATYSKREVFFEHQIDFNFRNKPRNYSISVIPMIEESSVSTGILILMDDITELSDALKGAESASRAKTNFLSTMSHEMRTPMNAIIGMTAIGRKTDSLEDKNNAFTKIGDASSHLLGIINDVLDMAKIEANRLVLNITEYNFEKMLQKVVDVVNFRVDEKAQELSVDLDKAIPCYVVGDDQRLSQVLANLLSNAVKFTPEGGRINLEVSLHGENDGVCELLISVSDNGIGISAEQHERLFQAFEQAESSTSREYGGTGLGLVISKRIVELMGGKIWVESELGVGSKFIFTIKTKRGKTSPADMDVTAADCETVCAAYDCNTCENKSQCTDGAFAGKRMLLAEDIEINREILIALLEDTGIIIDCAENGIEALNMVESEPDKYDIVFMDVQMPKMDGREATRRIRALPVMRDIRLPIVAMTANVFKSDVEECLAAGMDDHLGKPLDIDKVTEVLRMYLGDQGGLRPQPINSQVSAAQPSG